MGFATLPLSARKALIAVGSRAPFPKERLRARDERNDVILRKSSRAEEIGGKGDAGGVPGRFLSGDGRSPLCSLLSSLGAGCWNLAHGFVSSSCRRMGSTMEADWPRRGRQG